MRLRSLDLFRGLTIAGMVIVNNPGDWSAVYWPLLHAEWHGWTPTDLIFPFFLFIVGVAMPLGRERSWRTILRRSAVILALGLFVSGFPFFRLDTWRIPGVLQRIALCYLAGAALLRATRRLAPRARRLTVAGMAAACLVVYWVLLMWVPAPGGSAGDLSAEGNLGAWLDRQLMAGHLWRQGWDPEGVLSTMPAIATTLLGILAGWLIAEGERGEPARATRTLAAWGTAGIVIGLAWDVVFPINKSLWTSSYAIFTSGLAAFGLAACHWWVDINDTPLAARGESPRAARRRGAFPPEAQRTAETRATSLCLKSTIARSLCLSGRVAFHHGLPRRRLTEPLVALGRNALLLFVLSGLLAKTFIYLRPDGSVPLGRWLFVQLFEPLGPPKVASVLYAVANLAMLGGVCWFLHRRGRYFTA